MGLAVTLLLAYLTVQVTSKCPNGWMPYDTSCYRIFENKVTWPQALFECETHNAYLAVIDKIQENENVRKLIKDIHLGKTSVWIGLADLRIEGVFEWEETKRNATFTDWAGNEPNQYHGHNEDCVTLYGNADHRWNDENCHSQFPYLCERHRDTPVD